MTVLEDWVRTSGLPRRVGWTYVDHREAWACSVDDTERVSMHRHGHDHAGLPQSRLLLLPPEQTADVARGAGDAGRQVCDVSEEGRVAGEGGPGVNNTFVVGAE